MDIHSQRRPEALVWIRKRGGSVMAFDPAKIASSIYAACQQAEPEDSAFRAQEFSQAVLHFLAEEFEDRIPDTDEVSETVVKVLREIGQGPTAKAYCDYRDRRDRFRQNVRIWDASIGPRSSELEEPSQQEFSLGLGMDGNEPDAQTGKWDKGYLVRNLETEYYLDPSTAREIAASIEKKLLACEFAQVSAGLIRELVDCELSSRGLRSSLSRRRFLGVRTAQIDAQLLAHCEPEEVHEWAGRQVLGQYALQEIYSPDVSGLHSDGLLHLFGTAYPAHWSAVSVDALAIAGRTRGVDHFLDELETELGGLLRQIQGTIAIAFLDSVLALIAEKHDDSAELADRTVEVLLRVTRHRGFLLVNLCGRIPMIVAEAMSEGPLFRVRPTELQERLADDLSRRLAERILEDRRLSTVCGIDYHPDLDCDEEELRLRLRPWSREVLKNSNLRFCFDRDRIHLAEGLLWTPHCRSAVYQFMGIDLPRLLERLGGETDEETLVHRVGLLCDSAIRAGIQKREFLRRYRADFPIGRDRDFSCIVVVPIGLDAMVTRMLGRSFIEDDSSVAFGEQLLARMHGRLGREGRHYRLSARIDGLAGGRQLRDRYCDASKEMIPETGGLDVLGNTPGILGSGPRAGIRAGSRLHQAVGGGTTLCPLDAAGDLDPDRILDFLLLAAKHTSTCRLQFVPPSPDHQPPLAEDWL